MLPIIVNSQTYKRIMQTTIRSHACANTHTCVYRWISSWMPGEVIWYLLRNLSNLCNTSFPYGKNFNLHTLIQWPHKTYIESQHINYDNFLFIQFSLWSFLKSFWKLAFAIRIIIKLIKKNILKFVLKTFYLRHPPKVVKVLLFIRISSFKLTFKITNV